MFPSKPSIRRLGRALSLVVAGGVYSISHLPLAAEEAVPLENKAGEAVVIADPTPVSPEIVKAQEALAKFGPLFAQRRFSLAEQMLKEAEAVAPDAPEVLSCRAALLAETGETDKAREIYRKLIELAPDNFIPQFNMAELLCIEKKYPEAKTAFEELLKKFPDSEFVKFKLILVSLALKDQPGALAWAKTLRNDQPSALAFYAEAALALAGGEMVKGRALIEAADQQFGEGQWQLLHESLAQIGLVLRDDYPPR